MKRFSGIFPVNTKANELRFEMFSVFEFSFPPNAKLRVAESIHVALGCVTPGLSKAETQALTNYGSGEDENDEEEMEEFAAGPVDVQTSLQASTDGQEAGSTADHMVSLALAR